MIHFWNPHENLRERTGIKILAQCEWAGQGHQLPHQELVGQLTKCEVEIEGRSVVFYVRENLDRQQLFLLSSNERMALKGGHQGKRKPMMSRQVLELCAPDWCWDEIAVMVQEADAHGRGVRGHRLFTKKWAEERLRQWEREMERMQDE